MLVKHKQTKELKLKISSDIIHDLECVIAQVKEHGYDIDVNASVEKYLAAELIKVRKQMDKHNPNTLYAVKENK